MFLAAAPNMTWLELLEWQNLFPGVDALIAKAQIPFFLAAFVMLVGYVATTISKQNGRFDIGEYARPFVLAILAAVAIGSINEVVPKGMEIGKAMAQEMGGKDFKGVVDEVWNSAAVFLPSAKSEVSGTNGTKIRRFWDEKIVRTVYGCDTSLRWPIALPSCLVSVRFFSVVPASLP